MILRTVGNRVLNYVHHDLLISANLNRLLMDLINIVRPPVSKH